MFGELLRSSNREKAHKTWSFHIETGTKRLTTVIINKIQVRPAFSDPLDRSPKNCSAAADWPVSSLNYKSTAFPHLFRILMQQKPHPNQQTCKQLFDVTKNSRVEYHGTKKEVNLSIKNVTLRKNFSQSHGFYSRFRVRKIIPTTLTPPFNKLSHT